MAIISAAVLLVCAALLVVAAWLGARLAVDEWRDPIVGPGRSFAIMAWVVMAAVLVLAASIPFAALKVLGW